MSKTRDIIEEVVLELTGEKEVDHSTNLFDAGLLTSVDSLDMLAQLEAKFGLSVPDEELTIENFGTVDGMVLLMDRLLAAGN